MKNKRKIIRRIVQAMSIIVLLSPALGYSFFKGSLISSDFFGIELSDPLSFFEYTLASQKFNINLLVSTVIVIVSYFLIGGRVFCGWICPVHLISEFTGFLNDKFKIKNYMPANKLKYWLLGISLFLSLILSFPVFTSISPIGIVSNSITGIYNFGGAQASIDSLAKDGPLMVQSNVNMFLSFSMILILLLVLIEIFFSKNFWCRFACPVGGFYSLVGRFSPVKIKINNNACIQCNDCFNVCMVPDVLNDPVYKRTEWVLDGNCTNCLNCVDACPTEALKIGLKFNREKENA